MGGGKFDHLDEESIFLNLGVRLSLVEGFWTSRHMEYSRLPDNPGWAVYRGCTVRDGDAIVPVDLDPDKARPSVCRVLDSSVEVVDLSALTPKKRGYKLAGAGMFSTTAHLRSVCEGAEVTWLPRPDNPFDENAVEVYISGIMVGHLPGSMAKSQARMLSALPGHAFLTGRYSGEVVTRWDELELQRPEPKEIAALLRSRSPIKSEV